MFNRLLVPVDGSEPAMAALGHAVDIASDHGATVHLLNVANTNEPSLVRLGGDIVDVLEREGEEIVANAQSQVEERGVSVVGDVIQGDPQSVIVEYAAAKDADLVVMGAHGRHGVGEYILGSVTEHVVRACDTLVLTVRAGEDVTLSYPYDAILVPVDGSDHATAALKAASAIANRHDAVLHLLFVVDRASIGFDTRSPQITGQLEKNAQRVLDEAAAIVADGDAVDVVAEVQYGSVPRKIRSFADSADIDLIVMGTHGRTGLDRLLLGSVTERVLRIAPSPVLTTNRVD